MLGPNCHGWEGAWALGACLPPYECEPHLLVLGLFYLLLLALCTCFCGFQVLFLLVCLPSWVLARKEPWRFSLLNQTYASWICCLAKFPSSRLGMSTTMSLVGAPTSLPGCDSSCKEGLLDTLGGDAPQVSGLTGTTAASGPRRSCRDGTDDVRALGISSVFKLMSSVSKIL